MDRGNEEKAWMRSGETGAEQGATDAAVKGSESKLDPGSEEVQGKEAAGVRRLNKKVLVAVAVGAVALLAILMTMTGGETPEEEFAREEAGPADVNEGQLDTFIENQGRQEPLPDAGFDFESTLSAEERKSFEEAEELQRALEARVEADGADAGTDEPDAEDPWEKARKQAVQRYAAAYFQDNFAARKSALVVYKASSKTDESLGAKRAAGEEKFDEFEYMRQMQRAAMASATTNGGLSDEKGDKQTFFANRDSEPTRSYHKLEEQVSVYEIQAGTILPLVLETGINSELPGMVKARFSSPVYDTATGEHLLIPSGAYVIGQYNDSQQFGESRVQVAWSRLILPNGKSMMLGNLPGVSLSGASGFSDEVDEHWDKVVAGALLSSALAGSLAAAGGDRNQLQVEPGQAALAGAGESINETGQEITKRNLEIEPTLRIRPGMQVAAFVREDLVLEPYGGE